MMTAKVMLMAALLGQSAEEHLAANDMYRVLEATSCAPDADLDIEKVESAKCKPGIALPEGWWVSHMRMQKIAARMMDLEAAKNACISVLADTEMEKRSLQQAMKDLPLTPVDSELSPQTKVAIGVGAGAAAAVIIGLGLFFFSARP